MGFETLLTPNDLDQVRSIILRRFDTFLAMIVVVIVMLVVQLSEGFLELIHFDLSFSRTFTHLLGLNYGLIGVEVRGCRDARM